MKPAVIYARVSSKDQEREGYSIPAQMKMLRGYALENESILAALQTLDPKRPMASLDAVRTLELANKACFLYFRQPPAEKAKLLRVVLSNCKIDALSIYPVYKKPFDVIFKRVQSKEWLPGLDSN